MTQPSAQNHFELFNLPVRFAIDPNMLDQHFRKIQSEVHPDRFASSTPAERLRSMQLATQVNEAYRTLKNPTARARYLLHLRGVDINEESNTAMPAEFLMLQMEWRESIEDAKAARDISSLEKLLKQARQEAKTLQGQLASAFDANPSSNILQAELEQAAETVRKLSFIDKICSDIEQAITRLED